jgi:fatty acid desaturase
LNSFCLGVPESVYRLHHLEHHRFNNSPEKDDSSTYKYGQDGKEENIFSYSTLGVLRTDLVRLYKIALGQSSMVKVELISLVLFFIVLIILNWQTFLGYVLTSYIGGQIFALWENYCEHHLADYKDRKRDSVSCYDSFYNLIWFNNGYHQEHHYSPTVHWTKIKEVKSRLPEDRVVVRYCHLANSFSKKT